MFQNLHNFQILGRTIVIHAGEDDLGKGGQSDSLTTGAAGARMACCVIDDGKTTPVENPEAVLEAHCTVDNTGMNRLNGTLHFTEDAQKQMTLSGTIEGFDQETQKHGFHVHEFGDTGDGCKGAGGHFNPTEVRFTIIHCALSRRDVLEQDPHGGRGAVIRHVGDLGNIVSSGGVAKVSITDEKARLSDDYTV